MQLLENCVGAVEPVAQARPVMTTTASSLASLATQVESVVASTPIHDIHTHLYDPAFGGLLLWGIDELLTYHYLVAEVFRYWDRPAGEFCALPHVRQAGLIWGAPFLQHSPISEGWRGGVAPLPAFWPGAK